MAFQWHVSSVNAFQLLTKPFCNSFLLGLPHNRRLLSPPLPTLSALTGKHTRSNRGMRKSTLNTAIAMAVAAAGLGAGHVHAAAI
ncbi:MAG: hypothetical protein SV422_04690, partial [Pseudomonadota bacterium]|nr:hypothetical protein [Pseudomonadota bacterium]